MEEKYAYYLLYVSGVLCVSALALLPVVWLAIGGVAVVGALVACIATGFACLIKAIHHI